MILLIFSFLIQFSRADAGPMTPQECKRVIEEAFSHAQQPCKWGYIPLEKDPSKTSDKCFMSCNQDDTYIGSRRDPVLQFEQKAGAPTDKYPMTFEDVDCGGGPNSLNKDPQAFKYEKDRQVKACDGLKPGEDKWHLDPGAPLQVTEPGSYCPQPDQQFCGKTPAPSAH